MFTFIKNYCNQQLYLRSGNNEIPWHLGFFRHDISWLVWSGLKTQTSTRFFKDEFKAYKEVHYLIESKAAEKLIKTTGKLKLIPHVKHSKFHYERFH